MATLRLKTAPSGSAEVLRDFGGRIVPANGAEVVEIDEADQIRKAVESKDLREKASAGVLIFVTDALVDVPTSSAEAYLDSFLIPRLEALDGHFLRYVEAEQRWERVELEASAGITFTEAVESGVPKIKVSTTASGITLPAPTEPKTSGSSWSDAGAAYYNHAEVGPRPTKDYRAYVYVPAADLQIRVVRFSDGAEVAPSTTYSSSGPITLPLSQNLPAADDALEVQFQKVGGGTSPQIIAGYFSYSG